MPPTDQGVTQAKDGVVPTVEGPREELAPKPQEGIMTLDSSTDGLEDNLVGRGMTQWMQKEDVSASPTV